MPFGDIVAEAANEFVEPAHVERVVIPRVSTGIGALDQRIVGGLPRRSLTLLYGPPKSGKSVFVFQFLHSTVRRGETCLYVMTDYELPDLATYMAVFQWHIRDAIDAGRVRAIHLPAPEGSYTVGYAEGAVKQLGLLGWLKGPPAAPLAVSTVETGARSTPQNLAALESALRNQIIALQRLEDPSP